MGQYFKFINFDKKEQVSPYDYDNLAKVMEHSYQGNAFIYAVEQLMKTAWKGDRVLYVGDYVDEYYDNSEYGKTLKELVQETDTYVLYQVPFKEIKNVEIPQEPIATRYIVNHNTKEYIDLKDQPIQYMYHDSNSNILYSTKIHPLSLMLCASNGAGGSYYGINQEYVENG